MHACCSCLVGHGLILSCLAGSEVLLMPGRTWLVIGHAKLAVTFFAHAQAGHGLFFCHVKADNDCDVAHAELAMASLCPEALRIGVMLCMLLLPSMRDACMLLMPCWPWLDFVMPCRQ